MSENKEVDDLLTQHKTALKEYLTWDEKVKHLLKGRRTKDLSHEDMEAYREAADRRNTAYDLMRHLERLLLDNIPGASTGPLPRVRPEDLEDK